LRRSSLFLFSDLFLINSIKKKNVDKYPNESPIIANPLNEEFTKGGHNIPIIAKINNDRAPIQVINAQIVRNSGEL
jgi:hypothetical protein